MVLLLPQRVHRSTIRDSLHQSTKLSEEALKDIEEGRTHSMEEKLDIE